MRKIVLFLAALAALSFKAAAWHPMASFATPGSAPRGLAAYGMNAFLVDNGPDESRVFYISLHNGSVYSSFRAPGGFGAWGVSHPEPLGEVYVSNYETSWIYHVTTRGSVLASFRCPIPGPADLDVGGYPERLFVAIPDRNLIAVVNPATGSLVGSYAGPGSRPTSCTYGAILIADAVRGSIYLKDRGWIISGFLMPTGVTVVVWIDTEPCWQIFVVDDATDMLYVWGDEKCALFPASLGRVKALFR